MANHVTLYKTKLYPIGGTNDFVFGQHPQEYSTYKRVIYDSPTYVFDQGRRVHSASFLNYQIYHSATSTYRRSDYIAGYYTFFQRLRENWSYYLSYASANGTTYGRSSYSVRTKITTYRSKEDYYNTSNETSTFVYLTFKDGLYLGDTKDSLTVTRDRFYNTFLDSGTTTIEVTSFSDGTAYPYHIPVYYPNTEIVKEIAYDYIVKETSPEFPTWISYRSFLLSFKNFQIDSTLDKFFYADPTDLEIQTTTMISLNAENYVKTSMIRGVAHSSDAQYTISFHNISSRETTATQTVTDTTFSYVTLDFYRLYGSTSYTYENVQVAVSSTTTKETYLTKLKPYVSSNNTFEIDFYDFFKKWESITNYTTSYAHYLDLSNQDETLHSFLFVFDENKKNYTISSLTMQHYTSLKSYIEAYQVSNPFPIFGSSPIHYFPMNTLQSYSYFSSDIFSYGYSQYGRSTTLGNEYILTYYVRQITQFETYGNFVNSVVSNATDFYHPFQQFLFGEGAQVYYNPINSKYYKSVEYIGAQLTGEDFRFSQTQKMYARSILNGVGAGKWFPAMSSGILPFFITHQKEDATFDYKITKDIVNYTSIIGSSTIKDFVSIKWLYETSYNNKLLQYEFNANRYDIDKVEGGSYRAVNGIVRIYGVIGDFTVSYFDNNENFKESFSTKNYFDRHYCDQMFFSIPKDITAIITVNKKTPIWNKKANVELYELLDDVLYSYVSDNNVGFIGHSTVAL